MKGVCGKGKGVRRERVGGWLIYLLLGAQEVKFFACKTRYISANTFVGRIRIIIYTPCVQNTASIGKKSRNHTEG